MTADFHSTRPLHPPTTSLTEVGEWLHATGRPVLLVGETTVTGLSLSSRRIRPGDLYAALPGARVHGIDFVEAALEAGASAVLTDRDGSERCPPGTPVLVVDHPREVLGLLAARLYGEPAAAMRMIGVTGTQGKTTTTRLAEAGLEAAGATAAVIGTVGTRIAGEDVATSLTTPEAPDLHGLFAVMRERGVQACAMEVSSHALVMGRVDGVVFDVAVFLNLGRDHLDFHAGVEDYYQAKASLFTPEHARLALINVDDEHGRRLAAETTLPVRTFSTQGRSADWTATAIAPARGGSEFVVTGPDGAAFASSVPLPGGFNVENALAAVAACGEAGFAAHDVADGLARAAVPGRVERVDEGQSFSVVVDYAHKPDAVEAAISALRPLTAGRVIVVLGAGGERDTGKRPIMAEIAARLADVLVITDDNPRGEDPASIRAAMVAGIPLDREAGGATVVELGDRRTAITHAVNIAEPGDVVLIAGKGHETGQEILGVVHPFDDRVVAREALAERRARGHDLTWEPEVPAVDLP